MQELTTDWYNKWILLKPQNDKTDTNCAMFRIEIVYYRYDWHRIHSTSALQNFMREIELDSFSNRMEFNPFVIWCQFVGFVTDIFHFHCYKLNDKNKFNFRFWFYLNHKFSHPFQVPVGCVVCIHLKWNF